MKKITLGLLLTSSLMMTAEVALDQTKLALDITAAKAQKSAADAKLTYELKIFNNFMFNQELSYRASFEEANKYFIYSKSSLLSKLSDIFSVGVNYKIDYANEVAAGIVQRDNALTALISLDS